VREGRGSGRSRASQASRADKYVLYQEAVQDPEGDVRRLARMYESRFGRPPRTLREDFCGTAAIACTWVRGRRERLAIGVDLDPEPLAWCRAHNLARLRPEQAARVRLVRGDVREVRGPRADVLVAFNFSYFVFKERAELLHYFRRARAHLAGEGIFVCDLYGGPESQEEKVETRRHTGFKYLWDQDRFDPITHHAENLIHFEFPDGSRLRRVFHYDWRLWMLPELRDLLREAGFDAVECYWEGTDTKRNEPNGVFSLRREASDDPAWIAYLVAVKRRARRR
jgi:hypothetical protein